MVTGLVVAGCVVGATTAAFADEPSPIESADTSSPRSTLSSFIDAANEIYQIIRSEKYFDRTSPQHRGSAARLLDCLDTSQLPSFAREQRAAEVAICLKEILDRVELPPLDQVPDAKAIAAAGGPVNLSRWQVPGTRLTIAWVDAGPQAHEYLFTAGTVERAVRYYKDVAFVPYRTSGPDVSPGFYEWYLSAPGRPAIGALVERLPDSARKQILGMAAWKWPAFLFVVMTAVALMALAYRLQRYCTKRVHGKSLWKYCLTIVFPVAALLVPWLVRQIALNDLTLRGNPLYFVSFGADLVLFLASLVVVFALSNRIAELIIASPSIQPEGLDAQLIRIIFKLLSLAVAVIVFLVGGQHLGFELTTLLASAGVGGLAMALAAQDTLKTLFGTLMLMADKPFRVGERIVFQNYDGIVEDIGLRSTRVRLLTGHQVTVPNDELARVDIENVGRRRHIRRVANIHLPLNTSREKLEQAVTIVRRALEDHEGLSPDFPPRVFFFDFLPSAFTIRAMYWYHPPDYWAYLAFSERFNLEVFRSFEEEGIQFSLPSRHSFWKRDREQGPLDVNVVTGENGLPATSHDVGESAGRS